jgi:hypothetical protein
MPSSPRKSHRVNLAGVPEFARPAILAQISRDEGIDIEEIVIES